MAERRLTYDPWTPRLLTYPAWHIVPLQGLTVIKQACPGVKSWLLFTLFRQLDKKTGIVCVLVHLIDTRRPLCIMWVFFWWAVLFCESYTLCLKSRHLCRPASKWFINLTTVYLIVFPDCWQDEASKVAKLTSFKEETFFWLFDPRQPAFGLKSAL